MLEAFNDSKLATSLVSAHLRVGRTTAKMCCALIFHKCNTGLAAHLGNVLTCSKFCQVIAFPGSSKLLTTVARLWTSSSELMFPWLALLYSASVRRIFTAIKRSDGLVVLFVTGCVAITTRERNSPTLVSDWLPPIIASSWEYRDKINQIND